MDVNGVSARDLFRFNPDLIHLNCGAHGSVPIEVSALRKSVIDEIDAETDLWFRQNLHRRFQEAADLVADTYNSPRPQLTLVENATMAISAVLHSLDLKAGDSILLTSQTYGSIRMQCDQLSADRGVLVQTIEVDFPFSPDALVSQYEAAFAGESPGGRRVAVIDHITSPSALLFPVEALVRLCSHYDVISVIDGAHAPGQLTPAQLDLARLQPDFYAANLHKWAFVPRSVAFLYVSKAFLTTTRPQVVSFAHHETFRRRFLYRGVFDGSVIAAVPAAFRFLDKLGGAEAVSAYVRPLVRQGARLVMDAVGGSPVCDERHAAPFMLAFFLGPRFDRLQEKLRRMSGQRFQPAVHWLLRRHGVVCPTVAFLGGRAALRVSAHVFSRFDDFRALAAALQATAATLEAMTMAEVEEVMRDCDVTETAE